MQFWNELKRRHVFRVAAAYAVVAWGLAQVAEEGAVGAAPGVVQNGAARNARRGAVSRSSARSMAEASA